MNPATIQALNNLGLSSRIPIIREGIHAQQQSPFLRLPSKLRDQIYTEIIDTAMHSAPPINFLRSNDPKQPTHKHDKWPKMCELSRWDMIHPQKYRCPGGQFLRVCKETSNDLRELVASRKASGKPTTRIDAIALDDALWIPRVTILPHWPDHGRDVEIRIEISCEVTYKIWDRVFMMIAMEVWGDKFMKCRPTLAYSKMTDVENRSMDHDQSREPDLTHQRTTGIKSPVVENVIFSIRHCMDECEDVKEREDRVLYIDFYSGKNSSGHPFELEVPGRQEHPAPSDEKPICAHLLQLVALIRAACPFYQTKQTFVIRGHHHSDVLGSRAGFANIKEADLMDR